tara:strand:+ start:1057 stop:2574 length:1518 start_codon:yes stop_codon:yes gene_type:complete
MDQHDDQTTTDKLRYKLLGSFLEFARYFYKVRTGRKFELSKPSSRESHYITIAKALTRCQKKEIERLQINIPPRYGKTELIIHFIAWCLARYPDSNFIYVSYSKTLATKQTSTIRQIVAHPEYQRLFNVRLSDDTSAKDNFETTQGGSVYAVGAEGSITGRGAGIANCDRFGGAIIIDDIIKPSDAASDVVRESRNDWYKNTLLSRLNNPDTPIIFIGQRVHEDDLAGRINAGWDGEEWEKIILPALSQNGHALLDRLHNTEKLMHMAKHSPYEFASQYQQSPQPAGGGLFKYTMFVKTDDTPDNITHTFITVDSAETEKTYNDATVFSFWGVYEIEQEGIKTNVQAIHLIDCLEIRVEPKDLKPEFMAFWSDCMRFTIPPTLSYIEKKSTGSTLISLLQGVIGMTVVDIKRGRESKIARFLKAQPYVGSGQVSVNKDAPHASLFLEHMVKITANNSHRFDDIADTLADAVQIALIDRRFKAPEIISQKPKNLLNFNQKRVIFGG